jgi:hypothetical protein
MLQSDRKKLLPNLTLSEHCSTEIEMSRKLREIENTCESKKNVLL